MGRDVGNILISVVMPVYNNTRYVEAAVQSVISQNHNDVELILVDDGSTDETPQLLDGIAANNDNVTVIHQENQWIYASFNNGVKRASGEYVYILNSDDKLTSNSLAIIKKAIEQYNHPDMVLTKVSICECDENQKIYKKLDMNPLISVEEYIPDIQDNPQKVMELDKSLIIANQANLYKRELVLNFPFRNDVYGADYIFNLVMLPHAKSVVVLADEIYIFHNYKKNEMNASYGKYYGYEPYMFDEFYRLGIEMMESFGISNRENIQYFQKKRKRNFTEQIRLLLKFSKYDIDEKVRIILNEFVDDVIIECSKEFGFEEIEARILSALREQFLVEPMGKEASTYFMYELLESLTCYEQDEEDRRIIENAVFHELNPHNIGRSFFEKLYLK